MLVLCWVLVLVCCIMDVKQKHVSIIVFMILLILVCVLVLVMGVRSLSVVLVRGAVCGDRAGCSCTWCVCCGVLTAPSPPGAGPLAPLSPHLFVRRSGCCRPRRS